MRTKKRGFTLVELLVVIAIIALLMAMLMPALAKVKKQANMVACMSNLSQWRAIFSMYTNDHDGQFFQGWTGSATVDADGARGVWMNALRSYYEDPQLRLCPMARKMYYEEDGQTPTGAMHPYAAYGIIQRGEDYKYINGDYTSYTINWFVNCPPSDNTDQRFWKSCNVRGGDRIPVLMDGMFWLARGQSSDLPSPYDGYFGWEDGARGIQRVCTNRHDNGFINGMFMDWSVRKIGLKELWTLKWHRNFQTDNIWTIAGGAQAGDWTAAGAEWMEPFRMY